MINKLSSRTTIAVVKAIAIGLVMGVLGVIIGAFPVMYLRNQLFDILKNHYGSFTAVPDIWHYIVFGFPLYIGFILFLPVGGAVIGIIGTVIGLLRRSNRLWLWGGVTGLLLNFLVSFHAQ